MNVHTGNQMRKRIFFRMLLLTLIGITILQTPLLSQVIFVTPSGAGTMNGSSWANAMNGNGPGLTGYTRLADTLRHAVSGSSFRVSEGTYKAATDNDRGKSFEIVQNVAVYGGFGGADTTMESRNSELHATIFSGDIGNPGDSTDNTKVILKTVSNPWTLYSTLDGLTILNSFNNVSATISPGLLNYSLLNVLHCTFKNNYSAGSGGGIYNSGKINIRNCLFFNNRASSGAGIYNSYVTGPTATSPVFIASCRFSNNSASSYGGGICNGGVATVNNCLLVNNSAGLNGGGIYSGGVVNMNYINTKIINSTLANNTNNIHFYRGQGSLWNSICWGSMISISSYTTPDIQFCCIQGTTSGNGVVNLDPLFNNPTLVVGNSVNGLNADWHFRWCSPSFNAASNALVLQGDTLDLDGLQRIRYGSIDMGCYELDTTSLIPNSIQYTGGIVHVDTGGIYKGTGGTWEQAIGGKVESCKYPGRSMLYEAMADAPTGTQIWVSAGTYHSSTWNIRDHAFTVAPGVKVFGGFSGSETGTAQRNTLINHSVFSGNIGNPDVDTDNSYHVFNVNPGGIAYADSALLDGIIIEKGYANGASALSEGGGMLVNANTMLRCYDLRLEENTSKGNGSGIKINNAAKVSLTNSRIETNHLILSYNGSYYYSASGCGIYNLGKLSLAGCSVKHNNEGKEGSGIYNGDSLVIFNCVIDSNRTLQVRDSYGVGLMNAGFCRSVNTSFSFNSATMYGGAINNKPGANMYLDNCLINHNATTYANNSKGGGIMNDGLLTISGGEICHNSTTFDGGGLFNSSTANCLLTGGVIAFNTASGTTAGGGGICNYGYLSVDRSKISNNQTSGYGGGIYNPTLVKNSLIANNTKGGQFSTGGGLRISDGCLGIFNSTIVNNNGQGIAATYVNGSTIKEVPINDTTIIRNCIVFGNDVQLSGNFTVSHACIENSYPGSQVIRDNPAFIAPTTGKGIGFNALTADFSTTGCSPCVNAGNNGWLGAGDSLDINDNQRVFETAVDLGAWEFQQPQPHRIDFSANKVFVNDSVVGNGTGTSWSNMLPGNIPSCRYPGYNLLYEAMRDAPPTCDVRIRKGVYYTSSDGDRNKYFLLKPGLKVYGGFSGNEQQISERNIASNPSVITANVGNPEDSLDNAFHVFYTYPNNSLSSDTVILDGLTIRDGNANYNCSSCIHDDLVGGGLFINTNYVVKMSNCTVSKNYGTGNFSNTPATIGKLGGGGIYSKGSLWIRNSFVVKNTNLRMGGAIFNDGFLDLFKCHIDSNFISHPPGSGYPQWGGAGVYNTSSGFLMVDSCFFNGNKPLNNFLAGGGIRNRGQMTVTNSMFSYNKQSALHSEMPTSVTYCEFYHNESAVFSQSLQINHCKVSFNGGGISTGGESNVQDCEIDNNSTGISSGGKTHISDCEIHHNNNGGISFTNTGGVINIAHVIANRNGAGINHTGDSLFVENCNIHHNIGGGGSGITIASGYGQVSRSFITKNIGDAGAAIKNYADLRMDNCLISNNSGWIYGVVCNVGDARSVFSSCTFANNSVNTGYNTITFRHGTHYNTPGISHFVFWDCIIQSAYSPMFGYYANNGGTDSVFYSLTSNPFQGAGNISGDPDFVAPVPMTDTLVTPSASHYTLSACSPCINAGSDSLTTDSLDLAGNIRKYNTVDMGALELKYDTSVTALWASNVAETEATIHWSRSVKPCETVVFIKDTVAGSPIPAPGTVYNADTLFGSGSNLNGWYCLFKGMDSTVNVSGLTSATTYRVAVFNLILDSIYDVPALMNFTTPGSLPVNKFVINDTIGDGEWACYNASNTIVVAGNGTFYKVDGGGSATLIAGQSIRLLPGTIVDHGGFLFAQIRPNGPWCYETKSAITNLEPEPLNLEPGTLNPVSSDGFRVKVWPNPVSDVLNVAWGGKGEMEQTSVELCNYFGARLFTSNVEGSNNMVLSLKNLPPGIYLLKVSQGNYNSVVKVIRN